MRKQSIIAVVSAAMLLTSGAPAFAAEKEGEQLGRILFGLAAVAAVSHILQQQERATPTAPTRQRQGRPATRNQSTRVDRTKIIPQSCLRTVETRFGDYRMYGARCMTRNFAFASRLPAQCQVQVYTASGQRSGYDPLCLREDGYQSDRRRN